MSRGKCSVTYPTHSAISLFHLTVFLSPFLLHKLSAMALLRGLAIVFLLLALYCGLDPFHHSPIAHFPDFEAKRVDMPLWSEFPTDQDTHNLLQKSEIKFENEVQGPESIAFDPLGRGPYTGLADGRIVFWNSHSWVDFAYTSPNRYDLTSLLLYCS